MKDTGTLTAEVSRLREELAAAEKELEEAEATKESDPLTYLAKLIHENKKRGGAYGYDYSEFGKSEKDRAEKVALAAKGDVDIAEAFIREFNIR